MTQDEIQFWFIRNAVIPFPEIQHDCIYDMPTEDSIEKGLTDASWYVRKLFAERDDISLTHRQIERGTTDLHPEVREVFERRRIEWEAAELRKRHASVVKSKSKLEAL